jgi:asparagine synthase (glutamine-hydrolysing)
MCGLFGFFSYEAPINQLVSHTTAEQALQALLPRGPDKQCLHWEDRWLMGHTRLAIQDLDNRSSQPFTDGEGNWLVFNGEIYNYHELRKELADEGEIFYTTGDTEVLLKGLAKYGEVFLQRLTGMFAFAWYCVRNQQLIIARDRFGVKPLVYTQTPQGVSFASDIRALLALHSGLDQEDNEAMALFFMLGYIPAPYTAYKGIKKLHPGHYLMVDMRQQTVSINQFWSVHDTYLTAVYNGFDAAFEEYQYRLQQAIEMRMRSDVPVALMLSGGIDSSLLASHVKHSAQELSAYVMGFSELEYDESKMAQAVADQCNLSVTRLSIDETAMVNELVQINNVYDEPFADTSSIPFYYLCKAIAGKYKVALSGDGGDEINLGYPWQRAFQRYQRYQSMPAFLRAMMSGFLSKIPRLDYPARLFKAKDKSELWALLRLGNSFQALDKLSYQGIALGEVVNSYCEGLQKKLPKCENATDWFVLVDLVSYLPDDLLVKSDKTSMAFGLEVREPLLDHHLMELLLSLPAEFRYSRDGKAKLMARATLKANNLDFVNQKPKQGFNPPIQAWLETYFHDQEQQCRSRYSEKAQFELRQRGGIRKKLEWDSLLAIMDDRFSQYRWRLLQQF